MVVESDMGARKASLELKKGCCVEISKGLKLLKVASERSVSMHDLRKPMLDIACGKVHNTMSPNIKEDRNDRSRDIWR